MIRCKTISGGNALQLTITEAMKLGREAAECISGNFIKAKALVSHDDEDEDSNDDYNDEEESQSPIDKVDPFTFIVHTGKVMQASDPLRF
ncbi:importin beta-like SAD2 [Hevea brasiliensis]|uniref:importin beta-like SAD2 n=1 Tax=Hevea brasiliensis TaxID=3981 RepID=UPI0025CCCA95|nr:importin beta-like SAD2 [Hevea brasiliensis]